MNYQKMEDEIKKYLVDNNFKYEKINSFEKISLIYNFIKTGTLNANIGDIDVDILNHMGIYYMIKNDYDNICKYFLLAIEKGDVNSMNCLANYYEEIQDYDNMLKYYHMAIEKGCIDSMYDLACYYEEMDIDNMLKYLHMAIEKGSVKSMNKLGN